MRIFSKKSLQFDDPAGEQPAVFVQHNAFADVPDWVAKSAMYTLAENDGDIELIGSKADEIAAETGTKAKTKVQKEAQAEEEAKAAAENQQ